MIDGLKTPQLSPKKNPLIDLFHNDAFFATPPNSLLSSRSTMHGEGPVVLPVLLGLVKKIITSHYCFFLIKDKYTDELAISILWVLLRKENIVNIQLPGGSWTNSPPSVLHRTAFLTNQKCSSDLMNIILIILVASVWFSL